MIDPKYLNIDGIVKATAPLDVKQQYFIKRAKEIHGNKFSYDKVQYVSAKHKVIIVCPKHRDIENHLSQKSGCKYFANNVRLSKEVLQSKSDTVYGQEVLDFSKFEYINSKTASKVRCTLCENTFNSTPQNLFSNKVECPHCHSLDIAYGYIYVASSPDLPDTVVKLGISNNPVKRTAEVTNISGITLNVEFTSKKLPTNTARIAESLILHGKERYKFDVPFNGCTEFILIDSIQALKEELIDMYPEYFQ